MEIESVFFYFEIENSIKMPGIIFCFDLINLTINKNIKLTESHLNNSTKHISIEKVFTNIKYLNKSNDLITLNSNFRNSELKVGIFYFLDKKCFKIKQNIEYSRDQFYFLDNKEVLKVNFRKLFNLNQLDVTINFFTKIENKMQFSKIEKLVNNENAYTSIQEINLVRLKIHLYYSMKIVIKMMLISI